VTDDSDGVVREVMAGETTTVEQPAFEPSRRVRVPTPRDPILPSVERGRRLKQRRGVFRTPATVQIIAIGLSGRVERAWRRFKAFFWS
jgi:hypothetical protein